MDLSLPLSYKIFIALALFICFFRFTTLITLYQKIDEKMEIFENWILLEIGLTVLVIIGLIISVLSIIGFFI